jgi:hypothetical protein
MVSEEDSFVIYISTRQLGLDSYIGRLTFGIMVNKSSVRSVLIFISKSPTSAGEGGERLAGVIEGTTICGRRCGDWVVTLVAADPADRRESPIRLLKGEFLSYQVKLEEEGRGSLRFTILRAIHS